MYKQIDSNRHKSWLLIALFTGVLAAAGYAYGYVTGSGNAGIAFALALSVGMTLVSYFAGDRIVLATSGAQELTDRSQNKYIWDIVDNLCIADGLSQPRVYIMDDPAPNAFATGRDAKHASVAMTTGLLQMMDKDELQGVLAHELSHVKNLDVRFMMLVAVLVGALSLLGQFFFRGSLYGGRRGGRDRDDSGGLFLILGIVFLIVAPIVGQLIKLAVSRKREYLADASGALLTRYPEGLARALEKIRDAHQPVATASPATAHLWIASPFAENSVTGKLAALFSTHPPIDDRIKQLRLMADAN